MTQPIRALIFDMDGLLVDSEPLAEVACRQFVAEQGLPWKPEILTGMIGRRLPDAVGILCRAYNLDGDLDGDLDGHIARFDHLRLEALRGNLVALPGAVELVAWGHANGLRVGLATSGVRHHVDLTLSEIGLTGQFHAEVTGGEVAHGKPAPDLFLTCADRLGVQPGECVVFEDSLPGLAAGQAAGIRTVWVPNAHSSGSVPAVAPTLTVVSLTDALPWVADRIR